MIQANYLRIPLHLTCLQWDRRTIITIFLLKICHISKYRNIAPDGTCNEELVQHKMKFNVKYMEGATESERLNKNVNEMNRCIHVYIHIEYNYRERNG